MSAGFPQNHTARRLVPSSLCCLMRLKGRPRRSRLAHASFEMAAAARRSANCARVHAGYTTCRVSTRGQNARVSGSKKYQLTLFLLNRTTPF